MAANSIYDVSGLLVKIEKGGLGKEERFRIVAAEVKGALK